MKWTTVLITSGNPDFQQYAPITDPEIIEVDSYDQLINRIQEWKNFWQVGGGNWMEPTVLRDEQPLGFLTYNNKLMRYEIKAIPDEDIYGDNATVSFDDYRIDTKTDRWWDSVDTAPLNGCKGLLRGAKGQTINCYLPALFYVDQYARAEGRDYCWTHTSVLVDLPRNNTHNYVTMPESLAEALEREHRNGTS